MGQHSWGYGDEQASARKSHVVFREAGNPTLHQGSALRVECDQVHFETDYGVAPGSSLNLSMTELEQDESQREVSMEVVRVDTRPGGGFCVSGRLLRGR